MERRTFFKISAITGAAAALDGCGKPDHQLIRFIPDEDLVPDVATWKASICTMCPAGCGLNVRVMEGEAEVIRNGQIGLLRMGVAKKLEGHPNHPVNQGKLCARGQAGLQVTYHPDRLKNPLKRTGSRGSGEFQEISWDEAIKEFVSQLAAVRSDNQAGALAFLTRSVRGQRRELIDRFLKSFGAPPAITFETFDEAVWRRANLISFGVAQLPTLDLAHAQYVLSLGADFLGTWNSPVSQAIGYGEFRQRRAGQSGKQRGKLVVFEPRMSQTGANADLWIPIRPGTEGILALGIAHVIMDQKLRAPQADAAGSHFTGWSQGLPDYTPQEVEKRTGVQAGVVTKIAQEMAEKGPAIAIIGGAPLAYPHGVSSAIAVNALNALLGSVGKPGGVFFTPPLPGARADKDVAQPATQATQGSYGQVRALAETILGGSPKAPKVLLIWEANPVFALPPAVQAREAIEKVPFVASFGSFLDETSVLADMILPDHSPLESWLDDVPESGTTTTVASLAPPAMHALHNTRQMPDILLDVAHQLGGDFAKSLPWKTYGEMLKARFESLRIAPGLSSAGAKPPSADDFWSKVQSQGGWWSEKTTEPRKSGTAVRVTVSLGQPHFDGEESQYPFHLLPYPTITLYDGSLAHLPWMQETPEVLSSAMWSSWVELNPATAEKLGVKEGDLVEVASQHGKIQAPVLIFPGIAPDVVAMPAGQGHENFTRYASHRGSNPLSILAPVTVPETGSLAWAATRVKITKTGSRGNLILFAGSLRENPGEKEPR